MVGPGAWAWKFVEVVVVEFGVLPGMLDGMLGKVHSGVWSWVLVGVVFGA